MKKVKKLLALSLIGFLFLTACGNNDKATDDKADTKVEAENKEAEKTDDKADADKEGEETPEQAKAEENKNLKGEITFSTWGSEQEVETNKEIIKAFEAKYPGTKVNLEVINDDYDTTIETRFLGGQAPDVIYGHPRTFLPWIKQGMLMDISDVYEAHPEWFDEDKYMTNLYDSYKDDGKYYATVNGADTLLLFYNKDLIESVGGKLPTKDSTWEELIELGKLCTTKNEDGTPKTFGFSSDEQGYFGLQAYIYANGGRLVDDVMNPTKATFNTPEVVEILRNYQDKVYKHKCVPVANDWSYLTGGFAGGQFAMMVTGVWDIVYLSEIKDFEWDIVELPMAKENSSHAVLYAGYAVSSQTKNPELAKEFAAFMMSEEGQTLLAKTGLITVANKDVAKSDEVLNFEGAPKNHKLRVDTLENSTNIDVQTLAWQEITSTVIQPNLDKLGANEITPEECAKEINDGVQKLLDEANKDK